MKEITKKEGDYIILFSLTEIKECFIPKFGNQVISPGFYFYCGSAHGKGGLRSRILRHLDPGSKKFWHIDFLKGSLQPIEIWFQKTTEKSECKYSQLLQKRFSGKIPLKDFGASDCKNKCGSHLIWFPLDTDIDKIFTHFSLIFGRFEREMAKDPFVR